MFVANSEATSLGPNRYPDLPIDIPNYLDTHGYFNSGSIQADL